jgi:hypothetical protein
MLHFTYQTKNIINEKTYVGIHSTENLNDGYLGSGTALQKAIKKYGKKNFTMIPLAFFDSRNEALEEEHFIVDLKWVNDKNNYNLSGGGTANKVTSEKTKLKLSNALKGREVWNTGIKMKDSTKLSLSKSKTEYIIEKYNKNGILLNSFDNLYEAYSSVKGDGKSLWRALNGKRKTYLGFVWKKNNNNNIN